MSTSLLRRRLLLAALPLLPAGCGLSERPYAEQRQWPLLVPRPNPRPPRRGGPVLEIRSLRAGPGLAIRLLQTVQPDGSIQSNFYEQWAVPPAEGVEDALRGWLAQSGLFSAVVAPGSRANADISLEGELTALWADSANDRAVATIAITAIDLRTAARRILLQRTFNGTAPLTAPGPAASAQAQLAALADAFGKLETALRP